MLAKGLYGKDKSGRVWVKKLSLPTRLRYMDGSGRRGDVELEGL